MVSSCQKTHDKKDKSDISKWQPKDNRYNLLTNIEDGQTHMIEDSGNTEVPNNMHLGKEIVHGIQSRPDGAKLDVQVYNNEHRQEDVVVKWFYMLRMLSFR